MGIINLGGYCVEVESETYKILRTEANCAYMHSSYTCWPSGTYRLIAMHNSNQSFYRKIASYQRGIWVIIG